MLQILADLMLRFPVRGGNPTADGGEWPVALPLSAKQDSIHKEWSYFLMK
jgi:hypothetical protein